MLVATNARQGTHFTCFTSTKAQMLTSEERLGRLLNGPRMLLGTQFPCFTGTKVQILTEKALLEGTSLVYKHEAAEEARTNADIDRHFHMIKYVSRMATGDALQGIPKVRMQTYADVCCMLTYADVC